MIYLLLTKTEWGNWIFISRSRTHHWTLHSLWQTSPRPARGHRVWDQVLVSHGGWSPGQRWIIFWCWKYLLSASSPVPCYPAHWITAGGDHQLTSNFYHFSHKLLMFCILLYFRIKETSKLKWKEAVRKSSSNKSIKLVVKRHKVRTFHKLLLIVIISSGSSEALISGSDNHTVFIKNSIRNNCQNCAHCSVFSVLFVATNISLFVLH